MRLRVPTPLLAATCLLAATGPAAAAPAQVALLPVVVHSSDPGSAYLSAGIASMLSSRLEQFEEISVIRLDGKPPATKPADAIAAGREAGAEFVVFGSFTQFGEGASLDLQCARVEGGEGGDSRRIFVQSGTLGEIIPKLDELAGKIRQHVSGGRASVGASAAPPASSPDLAELERRVQALERTVFHSGPAQGPAPPPAAKAPGVPGSGPPVR